MGGGASTSVESSENSYSQKSNCSLNIIIKKDAIDCYRMVGGVVFDGEYQSSSVLAKAFTAAKVWEFGWEHNSETIHSIDKSYAGQTSFSVKSKDKVNEIIESLGLNVDFSELHSHPDGMRPKVADESVLHVSCILRVDGKKYTTEIYGKSHDAVITNGNSSQSTPVSLLTHLQTLIPQSEFKLLRKTMTQWWAKIDHMTEKMMKTDDISAIREKINLAAMREQQSFHHAAENETEFDVLTKHLDMASKWNVELQRNIDQILACLWEPLIDGVQHKLHNMVGDVPATMARLRLLRDKYYDKFREEIIATAEELSKEELATFVHFHEKAQQNPISPSVKQSTKSLKNGEKSYQETSTCSTTQATMRSNYSTSGADTLHINFDSIEKLIKNRYDQSKLDQLTNYFTLKKANVISLQDKSLKMRTKEAFEFFIFCEVLNFQYEQTLENNLEQQYHGEFHENTLEMENLIHEQAHETAELVSTSSKGNEFKLAELYDAHQFEKQKLSAKHANQKAQLLIEYRREVQVKKMQLHESLKMLHEERCNVQLSQLAVSKYRKVCSLYKQLKAMEESNSSKNHARAS